MKDLSLHILDVALNSVKAKSDKVHITIDEKSDFLEIKIADNGCGMSQEFLEKVTDPFTTTRTTRKVGLGIPLFKFAAEQTGGSLSLTSEVGVGTELTVSFGAGNIDTPPLGDITSTIVTLIQGSPEIDFIYLHKKGENVSELDTSSLREVLGQEVSLAEPDVLNWITQSLNESEENL